LSFCRRAGTLTAAVLSPTTKSVDASLLLARTVTPEPMRPGWARALRMSWSVLPHRRLLTLDERLANRVDLYLQGERFARQVSVPIQDVSEQVGQSGRP
jgi:hypothetical protein